VTAVFEEHGLKIQYPENWRLTKGQQDRTPYEISIESPAGCLWTLHVFPVTSEADKLAKEAVLALHDQYEILDRSEVVEKLAEIEMKGYDLNFFCLDLLVEVRIRYFSSNENSFVLLLQSEDREFQKVNLVFSAITTSFLSNLPA